MNRLSPAVLGLVTVNVVVFIVGNLISQGNDWLVTKAAFWFSANENSALWQAVTYMFLHGGVGHLFFNMFALVSFGGLLERQWGTRRFLVFYFLCGVGAALIHTGVDHYRFHVLQERLLARGLTPTAIASLLRDGAGDIPIGGAVRQDLIDLYRIYAAPMLGASGAIYGVLVAFGFLYPNAKLAVLLVPIPIAAKIVIPILLALDLLSGVTGFSLFGGGVAHFAHLGGAFIGFVLMLLWGRPTRPDDLRVRPVS